MQLEVGKTYKDGYCDKVEIIHQIKKPLVDTDEFVGITTYEGGYQRSWSYARDGMFSTPDSKSNLVEEVQS